MTAPVPVLLVDDHELFRRGVRTLLEEAGDVEVVAEAADAGAALVEAERTLPAVVVMDVRLGDVSGIEATRAIRARVPGAAVLMLTAYADDDALFESILAGASGYVVKDATGDELVRAVRELGGGGSLLDPAVTNAVLDRVRRGGAEPVEQDERLARLSAQERRVLDLIVRGCTNRQIADDMLLSEKTVKNYVSSLLGKLEVRRRGQAAAYARSPGGPAW